MSRVTDTGVYSEQTEGIWLKAYGQALILLATGRKDEIEEKTTNVVEYPHSS